MCIWQISGNGVGLFITCNWENDDLTNNNINLHGTEIKSPTNS